MLATASFSRSIMRCVPEAGERHQMVYARTTTTRKATADNTGFLRRFHRLELLQVPVKLLVQSIFSLILTWFGPADKAGNILVTGAFDGRVDFLPTTPGDGHSHVQRPAGRIRNQVDT